MNLRIVTGISSRFRAQLAVGVARSISKKAQVYWCLSSIFLKLNVQRRRPDLMRKRELISVTILRRFKLVLGMFALSTIALANTHISEATHDWTGIYAGGFIGGSSGAKTTTTEPKRVDNNTNWFRPFNSSYRYDTSPSFIGGGTIGYNCQLGKTPWLVSLEGEYGYLNETSSRMDPNQIPYANLTNNTTYNSSSNTTNIGGSYGYAMAGGRFGYAQDRVLFYVKSGAVFTKTTNKYSSVKTEPDVIGYLNISGAKNTAGYAVGGGVEYALPFKALSNFSVKTEYLYLGIDRTQLNYGHCSCDFLWSTTQRISGIHTAKVGMNYKF